MASRFRSVDRDTSYLLPPSVEEWLPEDHLARFVIETVAQLDTSALEKVSGEWTLLRCALNLKRMHVLQG